MERVWFHRKLKRKRLGGCWEINDVDKVEKRRGKKRRYGTCNGERDEETWSPCLDQDNAAPEKNRRPALCRSVGEMDAVGKDGILKMGTNGEIGRSRGGPGDTGAGQAHGCKVNEKGGKTYGVGEADEPEVRVLIYAGSDGDLLGGGGGGG